MPTPTITRVSHELELTHNGVLMRPHIGNKNDVASKEIFGASNDTKIEPEVLRQKLKI